MRTLLGLSIFQPLDDDGAIIPQGKLHAYVTGTTTPKNTYLQAVGGSAHANPVVLDGAGRATIFLMTDGAYDLVLTDHNDATIWTLSNVIAAAPAA